MTNPKSIYLPSGDDSVLAVRHNGKGDLLRDDALIASTILYRVMQKLTNEGSYFLNSETGHLLIGEGVSCNLLAPGFSEWMSGKVRLALEFVPDEPEPSEETPISDSGTSPLDGIRQEISND
ncbi:KGK domain-containing protein [Alkalinema pantanalense CENA528]|uniref:KGK domain-containing protein n=1 Tax=Alkalinema pantanalense TaxID=1620705 RepID=UPI003D6FB654